jgi:PAS domain S-box-containing protein
MINQVGARNLGRPVNQILGRSLREFLPSMFDLAVERFRRVIDHGEYMQVEDCVPLLHGDRWFWSTLEPVRDLRGAVYGVQIISYDITERKRAEAALRRSEERLASAVRAASDGLWDWDLQTNEVFYSARWRDILGYAASEVENHLSAWERLVSPEDRDRAWVALAEVKAGRTENLEVEYRMLHRAGHWVDILSRGTCLRNANGIPVRLVGTHVDISRRKGAETALRELLVHQEQRAQDRAASWPASDPSLPADVDRLRLVEQATHDGIWDWDFRTGVEYHSARWKEILGFGPDELPSVPATFFGRLHPEDRPAVERVLAAHLDQGMPYEVEARLQHKLGHYCWILSRGQAVHDDSGRTVRMVGSISDITRRKLAEKSRDENLQLLTNIIESSVDMIFVKDRELRTVLANSSCARAVGKRPEELYGHTDIENGWLPELVKGNPEKNIRGFEADDRLALAGEIVRNSNDPANVGPEIRIFDTVKLPLRNTENEVTGLLAIARDITDHIRAERRLRALSELGRKLNSATSHREAALCVLDVAQELLGWDACVVELYAPPNNAVVSVILMDTVNGRKKEFPFDKQRLESRKVVAAPLNQARLILRQPGGPCSETLRTFGDTSRRSASLLFAPIYSKDRAIGMFSIQSYTHNAYSQSALETVQMLADYCGGAFERLLVQSALADSEARFAAFMNYLPAAAYIKDSAGRYLFVNRHLVESVGLAPGKWRGRRLSELTPSDSALANEYNDQELLASGKPHVFEERSIERGKIRTYLSTKFPIPQAGGATLLGGVSFEITERREAEREREHLLEQVQSARNRLEHLSRRLIEVQESERRRLARELHDQIGQALTAVQIKLQTASRTAVVESVRSDVVASLGMLEELVQLTQNISLNLRPSILDDLGLEAALRWLTERQVSPESPRGEFHPAPLEHRLQPEIETACFRVAQEAITNILRHARAREFVVSLHRHRESLALSIHDDGVGFDPRARLKSPERFKDLGLLGMEERVALVGGRFEIHSNLNAGTTVNAWFPLQWCPSDPEDASI